jgi:hypothetical protein
MQIYNYDPETGICVGTSSATLDPMETKKQGKDIYLIPAYSTTEVPPEVREHEVSVFKGGRWRVIPDHRGEIWWRQDGTKYTIETLGIAPAETDVGHDPRISVYYDLIDGVWVINRERWLNAEIRPKRDQLLNEVDIVRCNADKWEAMTPDQKQAWREYKQALRDLPRIIDYAAQVWPTTPED